MKVFNRLVAFFSQPTVFDNPVYPRANARTSTVLTKTAAYTVTAADVASGGVIVSNAGAAGTLAFTLPTVIGNEGKCITFNVLAAQIVRPTPVSGQAVNLNGSAVVTKYLNIAAVIGNYADLYCDGTQWIVTGYSGVVTKEA